MKRLAIILAALCWWAAAALAASPEYPTQSTPVMVSATGTTAATSATMPAAPNRGNYLCGFSIRALATGAINGMATVTGLFGGTLSFNQFVAPLASGIGTVEQSFNPCLPAHFNTAVAVNSIAPGAGGVVSVTVWGYQK
jgi:hypothetical protein